MNNKYNGYTYLIITYDMTSKEKSLEVTKG